jgi:hypothetical protein
VNGIAPEVDDLEQIDLDESIPCKVCRSDATYRLTMRCCGHAVMACTEHYTQTATFVATTPGVRCMTCAHDYPKATCIHDIARVVQL